MPWMVLFPYVKNPSFINWLELHIFESMLVNVIILMAPIFQQREYKAEDQSF